MKSFTGLGLCLLVIFSGIFYSNFSSPIGYRIYATSLLLMWLAWVFVLHLHINKVGVFSFLKRFSYIQFFVSLVAFAVLLWHELIDKNLVRPFFGNPNLVGNYVALSTFNFLFLVGVEQNKCLKRISYLGLVAGVLLLFFLQARAAFLGLFLGAICWFFFDLNLREKICRFKYAKYALCFVVLLTGYLIINQKSFGSLLYRFSYWKNTLCMISDKPFGVGLGACEFVLERYEQSCSPLTERTELVNVANAHNLFLEIAAEIGLPAFLALMFVLVRIFSKIIHLKNLESRWLLSVGALFLPIAFLEFPHETPYSYFLLAVCFAIALSVSGTRMRNIKLSFRFPILALCFFLTSFFIYKNYFSYFFRSNYRNLELLQKICRYDPENLTACSGLVSKLINSYQLTEAERVLNVLTKRLGDYHVVYLLRGHLAEARGDKRSACEYFIKYDSVFKNKKPRYTCL